MNQISVGWVEKDKVCQTGHMCGPPSAAQTVAHSACWIIRQRQSRLPCARWPAGGTEGQSRMREWEIAGRTDYEVNAERQEWGEGRLAEDEWTQRNISGWVEGKRGGQVEREIWIMGLNWVLWGANKVKLVNYFSVLGTMRTAGSPWIWTQNKINCARPRMLGPKPISM